MMIFIEPNTINLLREAGSYQPTDLRYLNKVTAIAA
jgi:hypothetical protein